MPNGGSTRAAPSSLRPRFRRPPRPPADHVRIGRPTRASSLIVPVYVYRREDGSTFGGAQRMRADALVSCPTTGRAVERVLQPFAARFKGTGFYATDHRKQRGDATTSVEHQADPAVGPKTHRGVEPALGPQDPSGSG